jgi:hypothetical protein
MSFKYSVEKDGITQGLLGTFLQCRQKAKWSIAGWSSRYASMGLTYGTIGHAVLEAVYTDIQSRNLRTIPSKSQVLQYIAKVERLWKRENPRADKKSLEYLELSCLLAEATMPLYFEYWIKDIQEMKWMHLEHEFKIPYKTSTGFQTILRGKMDGIFSNPKKVWLFESKFKSHIEEGDLMDTLPFDFQALFYLYALMRLHKIPAQGFLYNIVRRVGLKQGMKESITQFAQRCVEDITKRPEFYFIRREVSIGSDEMKVFEKELDGMIVDFIDWHYSRRPHYKNTNSCIDKYGRCVYLNLCANRGFGSYIKRDTMFRELEVV